MMSGALTIGTRDSATIEMAEAAGEQPQNGVSSFSHRPAKAAGIRQFPHSGLPFFATGVLGRHPLFPLLEDRCLVQGLA
jgi:hypothetical protein